MNNILLVQIQEKLGGPSGIVKLPKYIYTLTDEEARILLSSPYLKDAIRLALTLENKLSCFSKIPEDNARIQKEILINAAKAKSKEVIQIVEEYINLLLEEVSKQYSYCDINYPFMKEHMPFSDIAEQINMMLCVDREVKAEKISTLIRNWAPYNMEKLDTYKDACKVAKIIANIKDKNFTYKGTLESEIFNWTITRNNWELYAYAYHNKSPKYLLTLFSCRNKQDFTLMQNLLKNKNLEPKYNYIEYYLTEASDKTYDALIQFYANNNNRFQDVVRAVSSQTRNSNIELNEIVKYIATASSKENAKKCAAIAYRLSTKEKEICKSTKPEPLLRYIAKLMELVKTISTSDNDCYASLLQIVIEKSLNDLPKFLSDESMLDKLDKLVSKLDSSKKYTIKQEKSLWVIIEYFLTESSCEEALTLIDQIEKISDSESETLPNMIVPARMQKIRKVQGILKDKIPNGPILKGTIRSLADTLNYVFTDYNPQETEAVERKDRTIATTLETTKNGNLTGTVLYAAQKMAEANYSEEDSVKILRMIATAKGIKQAKVAAYFVACWAVGNGYDSCLESIVKKLAQANVNHSGKFKVCLSLDEEEALFIHGMTFSPNDGKVYYDDGTTITPVQVEYFLSDIKLSEYFDCRIPYFYKDLMETGDGYLQSEATIELPYDADTNEMCGYIRVKMSPIKLPKSKEE